MRQRGKEEGKRGYESWEKLEMQGRNERRKRESVCVCVRARAKEREKREGRLN